MITYLAKRIGISLFIVFGVLSLSFALIHMAPGDPSSLYIRPDIDPQTMASLRSQMGLDQPIWRQYVLWIQQVCSGNFGISFSQQRPVAEILAEAIPNTLQLTVAAFLIQLVLGTLLGVLTAIKHNTKLDFSISSFLLFLYSMPGFWLALMAVLVFSLKLGWLPSSQMQSLQIADGAWAQLTDRLRHLILPAGVLAAPFVAHTARFIRGSLSEVLQQDYIRTAYAFGIPARKVLFKYALKNAVLPLASLFGFYLPFLLGGAVITEYIFAWPGFGRITVNAIFAHDFPMILAGNFIAALAVVIGNLISDLVSKAVDPRIRG
ncbi:MAG: ABC transporter permease [Caldithrix sp.]|nr:MAG: ABC transporter permease [Caldithrix sp.]